MKEESEGLKVGKEGLVCKGRKSLLHRFTKIINFNEKMHSLA